MLRKPIAERPNWREEVEKWGMVYHTHENKPYWFESAYYSFSAREVDLLESATEELHRICMLAVDHVIRKRDYGRFRIPGLAIAALEDSWHAKKPHLYGRFDLAYDGVNPPKMLEYNADTPTSLLEAAVVQWQWSQDVFPGSDQFNSIWEALIARWGQFRLDPGFSPLVHFGHEEALEDLMTVSLLRDTAQEAGLKTVGLHMTEIGWDTKRGSFVDAQGQPIKALFKLYPWEWLVHERFALPAFQTMNQMAWLEPIWKMILSNKAILPVLWELFPDHPNLLPAFADGPNGMRSYVRKPLLSREGANIQVVEGGRAIEETAGAYGEEGFIYQELANIRNFDGNHPVIGSWVVGDTPCGMGIRESDGVITNDLSRFVPHVLE